MSLIWEPGMKWNPKPEELCEFYVILDLVAHISCASRDSTLLTETQKYSLMSMEVFRIYIGVMESALVWLYTLASVFCWDPRNQHSVSPVQTVHCLDTTCRKKAILRHPTELFWECASVQASTQIKNVNIPLLIYSTFSNIQYFQCCFYIYRLFDT